MAPDTARRPDEGARANPITATVPFDVDGKHHGHLRLPHSSDASAWGSVMIPVTVIRNGAGPTALLTGANHGDEYEGPLALQRLAWEVEAADVAGRIIAIPYMNYPAFRAGRRTSPLDGGNLNRIFPGRPDGSVTEKLAHYFADVLVPMADLVVDFHSGGKTLDFLPLACAHYRDDPEEEARCRAVVEAFNAPYTLMLREIDDGGMYDGEVEAQRRAFVTTELGGGGTATARTVAIAARGLRNVLIHAGILAGEVERRPSVELGMPDDACVHVSLTEGLVEPLADLGDRMRRGAPLARIWPLDRTGAAPVDYAAQRDGLLVARHFPGLIGTGDCLAVIAAVED